MSGDRKSSKAWQFFTDLQNEKAKCNFCQKEFSYKGGGAYNLTRHTKSKHPQAFTAIRECPIEIEASAATHIQILPTTSTDPTAICIPFASTSTSTSSTAIIPATSEPTIPSSTDIFKLKSAAANTKLTQYFCKPLSAKKTDQLNKTLVKLFAKNYLAFHLIESPELKEFIKELNPGYQLPSRKTLSNALMTNVYIQIKEKVKIELSQAVYVCITTDGWTSKPNENYLAVTVHFFNNNAELKSFLLECIQFNDRHTADNLAQELRRIASDWEITNKVVAATSDNANNIKAAIKINNWKQIPCFAHTLNLIVQTALKQIKVTTTKIKQIVEVFKRSPLASERLKNMQKKLEEQVLKLKQDVPTRWNSTCEMFERILKTKNSVMSTLAIDYPDVDNITSDDIQIIESASEILSFFKDVTEEMSSERNVTISEVPMVF